MCHLGIKLGKIITKLKPSQVRTIPIQPAWKKNSTPYGLKWIVDRRKKQQLKPTTLWWWCLYVVLTYYIVRNFIYILFFLNFLLRQNEDLRRFFFSIFPPMANLWTTHKNQRLIASTPSTSTIYLGRYLKVHTLVELQCACV